MSRSDNRPATAHTPTRLRVVRFIKRAQELGFTLNDIEALLRLTVEHARCEEVQSVARAKLTELDQKIAVLTAMRTALVDLLAQCRLRKRRVSCPLLDALGGAGEVKRAS
jgi:DNA-binding transcriptional MerR regulator